MALLLLATTNPGKLLEMQALLAGLPIELALPSRFGINLDVIEDGETYAENAARKALAYSRAANLPALADDSGLEVDILGGEPGLHSHRYAPMPNASDADRRVYLLSCLKDKPRPWKAHFHCTVAIAAPTGELNYADGDCPGEIIPEERGSNGFGYDPIFLLNESGLTMAELSMEDKNRLSHRARAIQAAFPILRQFITPPAVFCL
jgi:XTP/dITP diphosphohydrolase